MRVLLQHRTSKLFFASPAAWVSDPRHATAFNTSADAISLAQERHLLDLQVVWSFRLPGFDFALPLRRPGAPAESSSQPAT